MSVRTTTSLHPATVTQAASLPPVPPRAAPRPARWNSPVRRARVDDRVLHEALRLAGADSTRLWFGPDGAVWVLNHPRGETCASPACPACQD